VHSCFQPYRQDTAALEVVTVLLRAVPW